MRKMDVCRIASARVPGLAAGSEQVVCVCGFFCCWKGLAVTRLCAPRALAQRLCGKLAVIVAQAWVVSVGDSAILAPPTGSWNGDRDLPIDQSCPPRGECCLGSGFLQSFDLGMCGEPETRTSGS